MTRYLALVVRSILHSMKALHKERRNGFREWGERDCESE